jgi:hypothetical protein
MLVSYTVRVNAVGVTVVYTEVMTEVTVAAAIVVLIRVVTSFVLSQAQRAFAARDLL